MTTSILVCDDEPTGFKEIKNALGKRHQVKKLVGDKLKDEIENFFDDVKKFLSYQGNNRDTDAAYTVSSVFKGVDVAIVDNNLSALNIDGTRLTAEAMIGYLRAFTDIAYIISLNKNPDVDFDLRYMTGDYQSYADLALNTEHLSNNALWQDQLEDRDSRPDAFAPSYWPNVNKVSDLRRKLIRGIENHPDKPILDVLGFPESSLEMLSRHAKGVLSPRISVDSELRGITCRDFFRSSCRFLPPKDRDTLFERAEASSLARKPIARTVAADLEKWLKRRVLGPQDVLVDLPHLLARMPFLLGQGAADVNEWNRALCNMEDPLEMISDTSRPLIRAAQFESHGMYFRWPCFWWYDLRNDNELNKQFFESEDEWADVVFCEDVSRFGKMTTQEDEGEAKESIKEFEAEFGGAWSRRYIKDVPKKQYSPRSWLAR